MGNTSNKQHVDHPKSQLQDDKGRKSQAMLRQLPSKQVKRSHISEQLSDKQKAFKVFLQTNNDNDSSDSDSDYDNEAGEQLPKQPKKIEQDPVEQAEQHQEDSEKESGEFPAKDEWWLSQVEEEYEGQFQVVSGSTQGVQVMKIKEQDDKQLDRK